MSDAEASAADGDVMPRYDDCFDFAPWDEDREHRGLHSDETPFRLAIQLAADDEHVVNRLGLPRVPAPTAAAIGALVANCLDAQVHHKTWVFYSRDRDHYSDVRRALRRCPTFYQLRTVTAAVDILETAGLLEHWKTAPSPSARHRSRIRATALLVQRLGPITVASFGFAPGPEVLLKDADGKLLPFRTSRKIARFQCDVAAHNKFLAGFDIRVAHPAASYDDCGFLHLRSRRINPLRRHYHRVFNRDFSHGGRWYGPFWQALPSDVRTGLLIYNEPTVEVDFRACHLRLLSAMAGLQLPFDDPTFDPFVGSGIYRAAFKTAFNIMLNAGTASAARRAIVAEFSDRGWPYPWEHANEAMAAVIKRFPSLADFWNTGVGLRLQNIDAEICARIQRRFRNHGVPILSVHDSFIVPARHKSDLTATMAIEITGACQKLAKKVGVLW